MRKIADNPPSRYPDRPIDAAELPWSVVHVRPRQEKALADDCVRLGIEYYLPLITQVTRRKDNNKPRKSILPLFSCYLSITGTKETFHQLFATGRIVNIITIKNQRKFIGELGQIYSLQEKGIPLEPCPFRFTEGETVSVEAGPLRGVRGEVVSIRDQDRLVLSVECLGRAMISIDSILVKKTEAEE